MKGLLLIRLVFSFWFAICLIDCLIDTALTRPRLAIASEVANPLFAHPHMLPSPFTIKAGRLAYGTEFAYGLTDFMQIGTNVLRDAFRFYNVNAKVSLLDLHPVAIGLTFSIENYNYKDMDTANPDLRVTALQPGGVVAFSILDSLALFVGGNYNYSKTTLVTQNLTTSGYLRGAVMESDLSWAYNLGLSGIGSSGASIDEAAHRPGAPRYSAVKKPPAKRQGLGNVLSAGMSYDAIYKIFGIGISHHWSGFQLGVHYYPAATHYPVYPIIAGGGVLDF